MGAKSVKIIVDVFRPGSSARGLFEACARVSQKNLGQKRRQIFATHEACAQSTAPRRATASALVALAKHLRTGRDSTFKGLKHVRRRVPSYTRRYTTYSLNRAYPTHPTHRKNPRKRRR